MNRRAFLLTQLILWVAVALVLACPAQAASTTPSQPATQQTQGVQVLEDTLFATRYDHETLEVRLGRLEETIFGQVQTGQSVDTRLSRLKSALSPSTLGPLSPLAKQAPAENKTTSTAKPAAKSGGTQPAQAAKNAPSSANASPEATQNAKPIPGETDYPMVSQMELKIFGKTYVNEDITSRLNRLEKQVFKTEQRGALADRVDNLRLMVLGDTGVMASQQPNNMVMIPQPPQGYAPAGPQQVGQIPAAPGYAPFPNNNWMNGGVTGMNGGMYGGMNGVNATAPMPQQAYNQGYGQGYDPTYGSPIASNSTGTGMNANPYQPEQANPAYPNPYPGGMNPAMGNAQPTPDMMAAVIEVEKEVIGQTFPSEPMNARLDRLENKVFHSTSPEMTNEDRLQRIIAVASAGGAPKSPQAKAKSTFQNLLPIILTILPMLLL